MHSGIYGKVKSFRDAQKRNESLLAEYQPDTKGVSKVQLKLSFRKWSRLWYVFEIKNKKINKIDKYSTFVLKKRKRWAFNVSAFICF